MCVSVCFYLQDRDDQTNKEDGTKESTNYQRDIQFWRRKNNADHWGIIIIHLEIVGIYLGYVL